MTGGVRHVADIRADDMSKDSASHIGLQMGSNKGATQSGMTMGAVRHVADIRADDLSKDGASVIHLQMGSNKGATQAGMNMGGLRHVADIRADDMDKASHGVINLQYGTAAGATQAGMTMGGRRDVSKVYTTWRHRRQPISSARRFTPECLPVCHAASLSSIYVCFGLLQDVVKLR